MGLGVFSSVLHQEMTISDSSGGASKGDERLAMSVMLIVLMASSVLCCYVCLKNRGKICRRGGSVDGPAVPPELP